MMFQKQNINKNSFSCEPCEWSCEPFLKIIHTVKAFIFKPSSIHVNDVNHFLACARDGEKHILKYFCQSLIIFRMKNNQIKNNSRAIKYDKSFTSLTCVTCICFYIVFYVNDYNKSLTRSFTSFTWI